MKYYRVVRVFGIAVILFLLMAMIPVAPVLAAPSIIVDPEQGRIGERITVWGTGFNKSTSTTDKYAAIFFSNEKATTSDYIGTDVDTYERVKDAVWLDEDGAFKISFTVPTTMDDGDDDEDVGSGTYYIYVCHYSGTTLMPLIRAIDEFRVIMGEIALSPQKGAVGTLVEISGTGFPEHTNLTFQCEGIYMPVESGHKQTGTTGSFITIVRIPEVTGGTHKVSAIASGIEISANFIVKPEITVYPTSGEAKSLINISGTGFGDRVQVTLWFNNIQMASTVSNALGSFSRSFDVPDLGVGLYTIEAEGITNVANTRFTIIVTEPEPTPTPKPEPEPTPAPTTVSLSSTNGFVGQGLVISGSGFKANGMIAINYDSEMVAATNADNSGLFAASFTVPKSVYGAHIISASDGVSTKEITLLVESVPPPVPTILSPEAGANVKAPISFYWTPVVDDSQPVTYSLQVATSRGFTPTSMLVDREGISTNEYTISAQEQDEIIKAEAPYYWRVKAVDGASNEGQWTPASIFYISGGFPGWALYTIIILGVIILVSLGYFLSMKTRRSAS
jgi:hypothetical protein